MNFIACLNLIQIVLVFFEYTQCTQFYRSSDALMSFRPVKTMAFVLHNTHQLGTEIHHLFDTLHTSLAKDYQIPFGITILVSLDVT